MSDRQPISAFGLHASNSAKKRQGPTISRRSNPTAKKTHGTLRFVDPSTTSNSATSPISVHDDDDEADDDVGHVRDTASSWENDRYMLAELENQGPYDETFKPPERDSQDETMPTTFLKTRHQPPRHAIGRDSRLGGRGALFTEAHGQYTPPATSSRQARGDRAQKTSMQRPHENDTSHSSDPVETPVAGPSRPRSHAKTPLTARRVETDVDIAIISANSARPAPATVSQAGSTSTGPGRAQHQKNWLSKRSAKDADSSRNTAIQTKLTAYINDKAPATDSHPGRSERRRVEVVVPPLSAINASREDQEDFEESVQFVGMQKTTKAAPNVSSSRENPLPSVLTSRVITNLRPQPRRKKRKSDEITGSSDAGDAGDHGLPTNDLATSDDLSSRLKSHKRFKKQQERQADGSGSGADETSSLTSLSRGPSSDAGNDEGHAPSAVRIVRGRAGRAMKIVCSSDAEEMAQDAELAAQAEKQERVLKPLPSTLSSIVPDSQPWHLLDASLAERARFVPALPLTNAHAPGIQQEIALPPGNFNREPQEQIDAQPDVDMQSEDATQPREETQPSLNVPVRVLRKEQRSFPFPLEGSTDGQGFRLPLARGQSSITISSLRHSEPSLETMATAHLAAKSRRAIPSLTEDDLMANGLADLISGPRQQQVNDRLQVDSSQEPESLDFFSYMRKLLPPPEGPNRPLARSTAMDFRPVERDDVFGHTNPDANGLEIVAAQQELDMPSGLDTSTKTNSAKGFPDKEASANPPNKDPAIQESPNPAASVEETMLPLTLDTQLHRPGILSPNFQFRRRQPAKKIISPQPQSEVADLPTKQSPSGRKSTMASPQPVLLHPPVAPTLTPQKAVRKSMYPSPESMIENVQTLATWSPAKLGTFDPAAVGVYDGDGPVGGEHDKENFPLPTKGTPRGVNRLQESADEFIDGTYGPIDGLRLLETLPRGYTPRKESAMERRERDMPRVALHSRRAPGSSPDQVVDGTYGPIDGPRLLETLPRGYTPRKESDVERREKEMPRVAVRPRRAPAATTAFADVDQAWKGAQDQDVTPKGAHSQRSVPSKDDQKAQSKLASFGFLKNDNVKKTRAVNFDKDFEEEDDLHDEDDAASQRTFDKHSMSPTPRKASAVKALGTVPVAPIDPRMRPAGIRELQRRKEAAALSESSSKIASHQGTVGKVGAVVAKRINELSDDAVPSSQPSENQQDVFNSDSSNDVRYAEGLEDYYAAMGMYPPKV